MERDAERSADGYAFQANLHRDSEQKRDPWTRADFMPKATAAEPTSPEDLLAKVRALNKAFGGIDLTQSPNE